MNKWKPQEIIINNQVRNDPATVYFLSQCPHVPVKYVADGKSTAIVETSQILGNAGTAMLDKIIAGKQVVYIAPASGDVVDEFKMDDDRLKCPHFDRIKLASNGCFYKCDWCYLKLTYRAQFPYISVRVHYDKIKEQIQKRLDKTELPVMFNSGELADSLSLEHLTRAGREFIPWFGESDNGYLFMLTKSDNVDDILNLPHNGHTIVTWSMNNNLVSRKFEIGAPTFERRLEAAYKVQREGYPVRVRLDPIVPFEGWEHAYAQTIERIFQRISPERITLGTLRFEGGFYKLRDSIFTTGSELPDMVKDMIPMFSPRTFPGKKRPSVGKYSFTENARVEIFDFAINEIRKHSNCHIALCKESVGVWSRTGLNLSQCRCVCQLDYADMI